MTPWQLRKAAKIIHNGGIIAYPTESVFGLGCDPLNFNAVEKICSLKNRQLSKGLILIVSSLDQAEPYTNATNIQLKKILSKTKRPTTWLLPASQTCPLWIRGKHDSVAIRLIHHAAARKLCSQAGSALVSTSANLSGRPSLKKAGEVQRVFGSAIDMIVYESTGKQSLTSEIRDLASGKTLR